MDRVARPPVEAHLQTSTFDAQVWEEGRTDQTSPWPDEKTTKKNELNRWHKKIHIFYIFPLFEGKELSAVFMLCVNANIYEMYFQLR